MEFNNINNLVKYIQTNINATLQDEVAETVKETMSSKVNDVVYDAYKPSIYARRGLHGGLADANNITDTLVSDGVIEVSNDTPLNDAYGYNDIGMSLTDIVVSGDGYMYYNGGAYTEPRNFIETTKESLAQSGQHIEALKRGLNKRGIETL